MFDLAKINNFASMGTILTDCENLLIAHQIDLMHSNQEKAFEKFELLYKVRMHHLRIMEIELIPVYEKCVSSLPEGGKILYFVREKKLIEKDLNYFMRFLGDAMLQSKETNLAELFEKYAWFKDLLDHHDAREKAFLFPALVNAGQSELFSKIIQSYYNLLLGQSEL